MQKEIGSNLFDYDLNLTRKNVFWWEKSAVYNVSFFKSGRNAIKALCENFSIENNNRVIAMPAFLCATEIESWHKQDWEICFYDIKEDFTIDISSLSKIIEKKVPSIIFVQSYFGFDTITEKAKEYLKKCKNEGILIVEDITQSLFSQYHLPFADYFVSSLRKFITIPEGGVLIGEKELQITNCQKNSADERLYLCAIRAYYLKKLYFNGEQISKEMFREKFVELNKLLSENEFLVAMNERSRRFFECFDYDSIKKKRRANYAILYNYIIENQLFGCSLKINENDDSVPLFLPVLLEKNISRQDLQAYLAQKKIYCPIIWPKSDLIPQECFAANDIYQRILCFPIDQRYDESDMNRIISAIKDYKK